METDILSEIERTISALQAYKGWIARKPAGGRSDADMWALGDWIVEGRALAVAARSVFSSTGNIFWNAMEGVGGRSEAVVRDAWATSHAFPAGRRVSGVSYKLHSALRHVADTAATDAILRKVAGGELSAKQGLLAAEALVAEGRARAAADTRATAKATEVSKAANNPARSAQQDAAVKALTDAAQGVEKAFRSLGADALWGLTDRGNLMGDSYTTLKSADGQPWQLEDHPTAALALQLVVEVRLAPVETIQGGGAGALVFIEEPCA